MSKAPLFSRRWVRVTLLVVASILMFRLYGSIPLQLEESLRSSFKPPATAKIDDAQRQSKERILIGITNNAVSEIRLRLEEEDRWLNYKFVLVGALLGAFLARFAFGRKAQKDAEALLHDMIGSTPMCCALAFATIVALVVDIHVRNNSIVIANLGSWLAYFAEPALVQVAFGDEPNGFLTWEQFLRIPGIGMHTDPVYQFVNWFSNLYLSTLVIYLLYLGVLQEVSLKGPSSVLNVVAFSVVQATLLVFAWMSHTAPGVFQAKLTPFWDHLFSADVAGFFAVLPWALITLCSFPYIYNLYRQKSPGFDAHRHAE